MLPCILKATGSAAVALPNNTGVSVRGLFDQSTDRPSSPLTVVVFTTTAASATEAVKASIPTKPASDDPALAATQDRFASSSVAKAKPNVASSSVTPIRSSAWPSGPPFAPKKRSGRTAAKESTAASISLPSSSVSVV